MTTSELAHQKIAFIGGGNMASAMIGGLYKISAGAIAVAEPSPAQRELLQTQFEALAVVESIDELAPADIIVLAVKPQVMAPVCQQLARQHAWIAQALIVSIAAGTTIASISHWLSQSNQEHARIARAMPNTPALIGMGIAGVYGQGLSPSDIHHVTALLSSVGQVLWFDSEAKLDAVTAVSGSGPAYAFYFLEAMQAAGEQMGLSGFEAKTLAVQTMMGAAHLAQQSPDTLATLRERVTSKGGTTAAALAVLEQRQVNAHIVEAMKAAQQRAIVLSQSEN